jgi:hypothetical protein
MTAAPPRRWYRWSLRTMFVVVTVIGCWLGYYLNWVRQRHELIRQIDDRPPIFNRVQGMGPAGTFPWSLWLLGEKPREFIEFELASKDDYPRALSETQRLFPEAWIQAYLPSRDQTPRPLIVPSPTGSEWAIRASIAGGILLAVLVLIAAWRMRRTSRLAQAGPAPQI